MTALANKTPEELRDALTGAAIIANHAGNIIRSQAKEIERQKDELNKRWIPFAKIDRTKDDTYLFTFEATDENATYGKIEPRKRYVICGWFDNTTGEIYQQGNTDTPENRKAWRPVAFMPLPEAFDPAKAVTS